MKPPPVIPWDLQFLDNNKTHIDYNDIKQTREFAKLNEEDLAIFNTVLSSLNTAETTSKYLQQHSNEFRISNHEIDWMLRHEKSKWPKYLVHRFKFKTYSKKRKLSNFPLHLLIEPTSICNLKCVMCFQLDEYFNTKDLKGMMDWELFKDIVDQASEHKCNAITLASRGEPTLHPKYGEMLAYLSDKEILEVKTNTNATRLNEKLCHNILEANIDSLVFSVDSSTKESYEQIRVGAKFERIVKNITLFNAIREKHYPNSATVTRISGVKVEKEQDLDHMNSFWNNLVDQVSMTECIPRWDSYNNPKTNTTTPCEGLWERMYIWNDGSTNPCDFDYKSFLSTGNLNTSSISEIWRNEKFTKLRYNHLNNARKCHIPCDRCPI